MKAITVSCAFGASLAPLPGPGRGDLVGSASERWLSTEAFGSTVIEHLPR
jgi:hypothetical protein